MAEENEIVDLHAERTALLWFGVFMTLTGLLCLLVSWIFNIPIQFVAI